MVSDNLRIWFNKPSVIVARNIFWLLIGQGWVAFLIYIIGGLWLAITIVGAPWAVRVWQMSRYVLWPAGMEFRRTEDVPTKPLYIFLVIWWLLVPGITLIVLHFSLGLAMFATIIFFFVGIEHWKLLVRIAWNPFGITAHPNEWASRAAHESGTAPPTMR
ncbi:hypothetical protein GEMRC1_004230 [Eukaryota sp. GEM-RC1]